MYLDKFDFKDKEMTFGSALHVFEQNGFIHAEQWDYERVTFDYKMLDKTDNATYYLRVQAVAVDGDIPKDSTRIRFLTPILGRHYYPHGVEYDEDFKEKIVNKCNEKLEKVYKTFEQEQLV